jgi:protein N-lysine methyltransferase METTL21A
MLDLMQQNTALNSLESKVIAEILDWGTQISPAIHCHLSSTPAASSAAEEQYPDVILAADCVYFEPAFHLLLQTMHQLLGPKTVCYFCFKKRRKADWRFIKEMKKKFEVVEASYDDQDQDRRESIYLYEVRKMKSRH